jgi:UDP-N-acetylglucosamine:LPS N-acetylglucosamine transferase
MLFSFQNINMKICITCSLGGHLTEALQLLPILKSYSLFFFTYKTKGLSRISKEFNSYFTVNPGRNPLKYVKVILDSLRVLIKERPRVIISTGAGVSVPFCLLGKIFGSKIIFIETLTAIDKPSLSGRIIYLIADLFIVQWKTLLKFYKEAVYGGQLI